MQKSELILIYSGWKKAIINYICEVFRINYGKSVVDTKGILEVYMEGGTVVPYYGIIGAIDNIEYMPPYLVFIKNIFSTKQNKGKWKYLNSATKKTAFKGMGRGYKSKGAL